ncbi:PhoH Phosphate starvation-inducible protein PhoH, predicted ATPase [uncultured Caudovirales phage]|uniref:PhoH Phosphate starvation-inducible protein PhoH, predicted ATPase n=1 Tax=uncultured Caudovirales phage TaxID=2100421 RepID=A0A6J5KQK5_9CAUD|nr:PhoH Phosphate starvation-inducible protein PhoH, predicted ATPase [uncultured Caudovirales phage]
MSYKVTQLAKRRTKFIEEPKVPPIRPKTDKQREYLYALQHSEQIFAVGPAGTGKTWLPSAYAADLLQAKRVSKIILTRPNVPAGPSIGFFPGTLEEKMAPWALPFTETMKERIGAGPLEYHLKSGNIEIVPFETMRGRSFKECFVIVDEAQNLTPSEMYMVVTRIGEDSRLVVTGDVAQKDITGMSGLTKALNIIEEGHIEASIVVFDSDDIVRGGVCRQWVKAW